MFISIRFPGTASARHFESTEESTELRFTIASFDGLVQTCFVKEVAAPSNTFEFSSHYVESTSRETYEHSVQQALDLIDAGEIGKIVVSRVYVIDKPLSFDGNHTFQTLCGRYPEACVYYMFHEEFGSWIGATPEKLVVKYENNCNTIALAGTLPDDSKASWSTKEREEQEFVSEAIRSTLKDHEIQFEESAVEEKKAGKVKHLCTSFKWKQDSSVLTLAQDLHPTPAVSGTPKDVASALITAIEEHDRSLYTGFFGLSEPNHEAYFVNLRCMQVLRDKLAIYIGGGITSDSNVESEWNETVLKSATMLEAL